MPKSHTEIFELENFISTIISSYKTLAIEKGIQLYVKDDLASHVLLNGNAKKIKFLLDTVLLNTINYSGATRICFSTKQLLKSDKEILIEFLLEDNGKTGAGVRAFAYYRALVTAKKLIEELQGKSELTVSPSAGSMLKFIIKCAWKEPNDKNTDLVFGRIAGLRSKSVLVMEDNEINQRTIIHILQKHGIAFSVASNGKEGIDMLEKMPHCDLVIMDVDMPYMDGYDAANYIRKKLKRDIPIIGMTSGEEGAQPFRCFEAGMNRFIRKPFTAEELLLQACSFFGTDYYTLEPVQIKLKTA